MARKISLSCAVVGLCVLIVWLAVELDDDAQPAEQTPVARTIPATTAPKMPPASKSAERTAPASDSKHLDDIALSCTAIPRLDNRLDRPAVADDAPVTGRIVEHHGQ